ncbi:HPr kinase/phosphatase C-terminal domain-containing protein [Rhodoplanes sp. TEM]|uniref:HPr kinase/phosphatase C-terminal domain-containing protein n=1 Tax=Rhodoplanes tepidamans TaxID=200616 RepID=A0ABT5J691_RHOTP|nr:MULTISPECIES: HPr kinase/phosphatase C-terminal domain-containing protein [Rhodoplanes]MDC7784896.1 HPr kinase/phosphatase C-terminal domain-containing protein [Rhodoplanes tepidamans]MDC7984008.1 HPr kinase/phosphatase C-terminal domain-containing protein [Rhodoplanes sp. TEM]MDQ0353875.1 serine kinase of HPr protein (carbohydrate metabolism regulator) [Rhodoplanes tepidamans]
MTPTIHASAVLVGARAVLIRGPSGAGKSRLALRLLDAGAGRFARLVADDRTAVTAAGGRLLARPAETLAGLIEVRGLGLRRLPHEPVAVVGLVVDLADPAAERMPQDRATIVTIEGVTLPRLGLPAGVDPLPVLLAALAGPPPGTPVSP